MKNSIKIFLFILIFSQILYADSNLQYTRQEVNAIIKNIRKEYASINSAFSSYNKKTITLFGESTQGAEITGYYDKDGNLRKITTCYYGETGKLLEEYYYYNSICFFVFSRDLSYEVSIYDNSDVKIARVDENRYYFRDEKLIRWISGNDVIQSNSEKFIKCQNEFIKDFEKYNNIFIKDDISKYDAHWENAQSGDIQKDGHRDGGNDHF
jgi:hypothetical protein